MNHFLLFFKHTMKRPAEIPTTRSSDYSIIVGNQKNRQEIQTAKTLEAKAGFLNPQRFPLVDLF